MFYNFDYNFYAENLKIKKITIQLYSFSFIVYIFFFAKYNWKLNTKSTYLYLNASLKFSIIIVLRMSKIVNLA